MKKVIDKLEDVHESLRPLYAKNEKDEKFHLANQELIEILDKASNIDEWKSITQKLNKELEDLRAQTIKIKENQTKSNEQKPSAQPVATQTPPVNKDLDDLKKGLRVPANVRATIDKMNETLRSVLEENKKLKNAQKEEFIKGKIKEAITKHNGNAVILEPLVLTKIKTIENENGTMEIRIQNESGESEMSDSAAGFKSVDEYIGDLKKDKQFSGCFLSQSISGAGLKKDNIKSSESLTVKDANKAKNIPNSQLDNIKSIKDTIEKYKDVTPDQIKNRFGAISV